MQQNISDLPQITTKDDFKAFVDDFYATYAKPTCFGLCKVELSRINRSDIISLNFATLNVNNNYGSFAVFARVARLESNVDNEIIIDIDEHFVYRALYMFSLFIMEELDDFAKNAHSTSNNKEFSTLSSNLKKQPCDIKDLQLLLSNDSFCKHIGKKHKNIQAICEIFKHIVDISNSEDRFYKFQFVGFFDDKKTCSLQVAYAKLHALSMGYMPLRSLNLDGIFALLPNLAWSGNKAYELEYLRENEVKLRINGEFPQIDFIDKIPRYLMQVLPQADNIRILDTAKTRFGAFLGAGYTQMPGASYVNFNAGALGACMNEGRISSSVVVGEGTDIGGGASILGVLSGGNTTPISIGKNCLLGANSVTGISLGDGCIVDAGVSILAGSIVEISLIEAEKLKQVNKDFTILDNNLYKGAQLSALHGIHFRFTSQGSHLIAFRSTREIALNSDLH